MTADEKAMTEQRGRRGDVKIFTKIDSLIKELSHSL
jgi:hypothetical protein